MTGEYEDQMQGPDTDGDFYDHSYGSVASGTSAPTVTYIDERGEQVEDPDMLDGLRRNREIASVIERWSQELAGPSLPTLDVFRRQQWNDERHLFSVMAQCAWAVENDDILSTSIEVLEALAFGGKNRMKCYDNDQEDVWNQWARDFNLDSRLREWTRETFKISQVYIGLWWEKKVYNIRDNLVEQQLKELEAKRQQVEFEKKVAERDAFILVNPDAETPPQVPEPVNQGPGRGNRKRKKQIAAIMPTQSTIFDPTKIMPVGTLVFGRERFAYIASREEELAFGEVMVGNTVDSTVLQLIERKYVPSAQDKAACAEVGVDSNMLWLLQENACFRHNRTKAAYERFAAVRLKSVLPILELKQHLRASDRASLIGNTNFIVVITKGTDKLPAKPAEIANLQEQAKVIARLPVLIGDHRLNVEIVAPSTDHTLMETRWQNLDSRLVYKALQSFMPLVQGGNSSSGVSEMSRIVAKGIESNRHMLVRSIESNIFRAAVEVSDMLDEEPQLVFTPKRVTLDFQADVINAILKVRDRGDLSRETLLQELDYDQDTEALRRAEEKAIYDETFSSSVPFGSPQTNPFAVQGQGPPPAQQPGQPPNVGPAGQPRTEGGRPPGATDKKKRQPQEK